MDTGPGPGWADAVSKILRMGSSKPETNSILSKAKKEEHDNSDSDADANVDISSKRKSIDSCRLRPNPQEDALLENELISAATRGVVHLFNAVKTVNPKSDKKKKKKKKKKLKKRPKRSFNRK